MQALSGSWSGPRAAPVPSVLPPAARFSPRRICSCHGAMQRSSTKAVSHGEGPKAAAYPPLELDPPELYDAAWMTSFKAWVDAAIQEPVEVCSSPGGEAWSSQVHVLGVAHHNPSNPRAIQEVAAAVMPDAITCEQPDGMRNLMKKAAESPHLVAPLEKVLSTPISSLRQAHCDLLSREDRCKWELGLRSQKVRVSHDGLRHFVWRKLEYSELLAAVRVARKCGATLALMDLDQAGRAALEAAKDTVIAQASQRAANADPSPSSAAPAAAPEDSDSEPAQAPESALVRDLAAVLTPFQNPGLQASVFQWLLEMKAEAAGYPPELLEAFFLQSSMEALTPDQILAYQRLNPMPAEVQAASGSREAAMVQQIRELCSGSLTGKPRKRVLVVTGRAHALPLRILLGAQAQAQA